MAVFTPTEGDLDECAYECAMLVLTWAAKGDGYGIGECGPDSGEPDLHDMPTYFWKMFKKCFKRQEKNKEKEARRDGGANA